MRWLAAWFAVVPLYGAAWAALLTGGAVPGREARRAAGLSLLLALVVAALLSPAAALVMAAALVLVALVRVVRGRLPPPVGGVRSVLELVVPALVTWLALDGPQPLPAPLQTAGMLGPWLEAWLLANGAVPAVVAAMALVFHGATVDGPPPARRARWREVSLGYLAAVLVLAAADSAVGAGAVALLFVAQWPLQAWLRQGPARRYLYAVQGIAMAALFLAALFAGLASGP